MDTPFDGFSPPVRRNRWAGIVLMILLNYLTFIILPVYAYNHGVHWTEMVLFAFFFSATSFAITMGYHRFFAHSTFKAAKWIEFLLLFFGAATFEQSALKWSSMHRRHHQFTDTDKDPYNIKKGFFYAHMGWFIFWKQPVNYDNVRELQKNPLIMHQHKHYQAWAYVAGIFFPLLLGICTGHLMGALMWSVIARICLVFHSAFFINSFAHTFGNQPYDRSMSARDNWVGAFLTNGEGYHNFHHKFPQDYRNGIHWYHWDPTKWLIWTLSKVGLTWDLRRTPDARIKEARALIARGGQNVIANKGDSMKKAVVALSILIAVWAVPAFAAEKTYPSPQEAAGNVYKQIFDNDRVKVSELTFKPGDKAAMHTHPYVHFVYVMDAGTLTLSYPDGTSKTVSAKAGDVLWMPAETHEAVNTGTTTLRGLVTELK